MGITTGQIEAAARDCGFELAGVTPALPHEDFRRFEEWREHDRAGEMNYLTDRRGDLRADPRVLLPEARSIVCVGKLYNSPHPLTDSNPTKGWISRYAWGRDYHHAMREGLAQLAARIEALRGAPVQSRICVDTAPLLERSYARSAGLGWIGKNTCLINQHQGSWFFLGELLLSIDLLPGSPPPDRCGTCRRCIDACPTDAIVPAGSGWTLDARLCISYLTIEKRSPFSTSEMQKTGNHVFGCDICQDVCPWNRRAAETGDRGFWPLPLGRELPELAALDEGRFREVFRSSPVWRAKYSGFLRNVAAAMGNSGRSELKEPLEKLTAHPNSQVAAAAGQALAILAGAPCV